MEILLIDVAVSVILSSVLIWGWRVFNQLWLKPKRQETVLRKQGLKGTSYKFPFGDMKKEAAMVKDAFSKPINLTDDISPRIVPFLVQNLKDHGKLSFSWLGPKPRVTITNPQQIKEMTSRVYDFQKQRPHPLAKLLVRGVAVYDGQKWARHRRIVNPAFHLQKLKNMVPAFYQSCEEMVSRWEKLVAGEGSSAEVDVRPDLLNMTADVISRTAFGSSYEEGRRIFQMQQEQGRLFIEAFRKPYIPGWRFLPTKSNRRMKEIDREVKATIRGIINKRETEKQAGKAPADDLLGILLESNSRQDEEQQRSMSTEDVIEECRLFYFAGQETTSELLVWTMIMLGHHQDWQERARQEVLQTFGQKKPDFDGLAHLKVITMIINEVLRLYPPGPVLLREVHKEMKLGELVFPAGTEFAIPIILVHRDPELWGQDASEFKPDRFSDGISKVTKNQLSYLPFAWGPRICVAQNFALSEAKVALSVILQKFRFELSPTYTHAPYTVLTLQPQFGAPLILHRL